MPGTSPGMTSFVGKPLFHWLLFESDSEEARSAVSKDGQHRDFMVRDAPSALLTMRWYQGFFALTASAMLVFAEPGFSGFCWLSCGAQPDSQITSMVARMRPSGSAKRSP
jgi:hypothetical protein